MHATAFPSGISGVPAEVIEQLSPVIVHERSIRENSGGAGKFRGGCGQRLRLGVRTNQTYSFSGLFDRLHHPAQGFAGGSSGKPGNIELSDGRSIEGKGTLRLDPEVRITLDLPGGGGTFRRPSVTGR
ncbi:MAG: hydantoinase B/oxoprolinase family protein [Thermomicrobiales bacterium]